MRLKTIAAFVLQSIRAFSADNCTQMAAAISYYVLFSIVPLTVFLVSVFGIFIRDQNLRADVTREVVDFIGLQRGDVILDVNAARVEETHGAGAARQVQAILDRMTDADRVAVMETFDDGRRIEIVGYSLGRNDIVVTFDNPVSETLREVSQISAPLTVIGLGGMAWSASAMFGAIRRALNIAWGVSRQHPFVRQKLQDLAAVVGLGVLLLLSVVGTAALRTLREVSDDALGPLSSGTGLFWQTLPYVLPFVFSLAVFSLMYRFVPAAPVRWRDVWPGALVAAVLFEAMKNAFALYVANFGAYDALYGSLGGILLFLTTIFLSANILLFGAEMAAHMPDLRAGAFEPVPQPEGAPREPLTLAKKARRAAMGFVRGLFVDTDGHEGAGKTPSQRR